MENDLTKLGMSFNRLAVRVLTVESALQALLSLLPADGTARTLFPERFREQLASAMHEIAAGLDPEMDRHLTLCMNALLEAARRPPTQP